MCTFLHTVVCLFTAPVVQHVRTPARTATRARIVVRIMALCSNLLTSCRVRLLSWQTNCSFVNKMCSRIFDRKHRFRNYLLNHVSAPSAITSPVSDSDCSAREHFVFSPLAIGLFRFSGFQNSLFWLKEPILLNRMWYVGTLKSSSFLSVFLTDCGRQIGHNQTMLVKNRRQKWHGASCLLGFSDWELAEAMVEACPFLHNEPVFIIFDRLSHLV